MPLEIPATMIFNGKLISTTKFVVWYKEKGTYVALSFNKVDANAAAAAFTSPAGSSVVDPELVGALKEMKVGDALSLPKGQVQSERSFKVRVNKAAKEANRKLEWGEIGGNYVVRVSEIIAPATPAANGTTPAPTPVAAGSERK